MRGFREEAGMSQAEVAEKLGTSQPSVAKLEARSDVLMSTFVAYVEAVGARYTIAASFD